MKVISTLVLLFTLAMANCQSLPIDFESNITTTDFVDFDGGTATVLANPQSSGINTSSNVAQIVRNGGQIWSGSKIELAANLDFSVMNSISMKVYTSAPVGTTVKFKLEGEGSAERDVQTTVSNEWEVLTWDFTGTPANFNFVVFMFDFGNVGDGSANSTFLFDDVEQLSGGDQIDLPVDFESTSVNYTMTDFEGNSSVLVADPEDPNNNVIQIMKLSDASPSAGTTIGTPAGFATDIPLTLTDSKMTVKVWSPQAGTPVRLKVEDSNDPTHTCETETNTTVSAGWEILEFDFDNQAPGTELLSVGLSMGWTYNMASIFFNFGIDGANDGGQAYYFDDVMFGGLVSSIDYQQDSKLKAYPNPSQSSWTINNDHSKINLIEIFDLKGSLMLSIKGSSAIENIDATLFTNGTYLARVYDDSGMQVVRLFKN